MAIRELKRKKKENKKKRKIKRKFKQNGVALSPVGRGTKATNEKKTKQKKNNAHLWEEPNEKI